MTGSVCVCKRTAMAGQGGRVAHVFAARLEAFGQ